MPKVSVIMPCLNMEKYIRQCMDSVIQQTLEDLEILIVDAGSTDGTLRILAEYEEKDSRVHIVSSDKKSYGYQMNIGIAKAEGEYIGIVETDDYIQQDMFATLYRKATETRADYVKGASVGFYQAPDGTEWTFPIIPCKEVAGKAEFAAVPKDMPHLFLDDNFLWNGIYRRDFMKKVRFHETPGAAFQDIGALFQIISSAETGIYMNHLVYHYRQDNMGASSYNKKSLAYTAVEYRYISQFLHDLSKEWSDIYYLKMAGLCTDRFRFMGASGEFWEESREEIGGLRSILGWAVESGAVSVKACNLWQESLWNELALFLKDPFLLFEYHKNIYEEKKNALKQVKEMAVSHKVFIFGAGRLGQFLYMYLLSRGIDTVEAYCDNNETIWGKKVRGLEIKPPAETIAMSTNGYYIIAAGKRDAEKIRIQLIGMGVKEDHIRCYDAGADIHLLREMDL